MKDQLQDRLLIEKAGVLDTVQDLGRFGQQRSGINPCGAMDAYALQLANVLVGNLPEEAGLELHFPASVFIAQAPMLIALAGADLDAKLNDHPVPLLRTIKLLPGDRINFSGLRKGYRCYMAVEGGFYFAEGSYSASTNLKAHYGGMQGRALRKGDILRAAETGDSRLQPGALPWTIDPEFEPCEEAIRFLPGREWERMSEEMKNIFQQELFQLDKRSDRMGSRLAGPSIRLQDPVQLVSSAVEFGTIQLLPDGSPIVLMADHQTTGGYPRIGHVIKADRSKMAQLRPGDTIRFRKVTQEEAEESMIRQQDYLLHLSRVCRLKLSRFDHKL